MYRLSEHEALRAAALYFKRYMALGSRTELILLAADTELQPDGRTSDPAAWEDWMQCVSAVKAHGYRVTFANGHQETWSSLEEAHHSLQTDRSFHGTDRDILPAQISQLDPSAPNGLRHLATYPTE